MKKINKTTTPIVPAELLHEMNRIKDFDIDEAISEHIIYELLSGKKIEDLKIWKKLIDDNQLIEIKKKVRKIKLKTIFQK